MTYPSLAGSFGSAFANGCSCQADGSGFTLVSSREMCENERGRKYHELLHIWASQAAAMGRAVARPISES